MVPLCKNLCDRETTANSQGTIDDDPNLITSAKPKKDFSISVRSTKNHNFLLPSAPHLTKRSSKVAYRGLM